MKIAAEDSLIEHKRTRYKKLFVTKYLRVFDVVPKPVSLFRSTMYL